MSFILVGINHQTAPIDVREKVAISADKMGGALELLRAHVSYGVIVSTCNRTEIYTGSSESASFKFLQSHLEMPEDDWLQHTYIMRDEAAVQHLFRVASGLESMIVGEYEVLGQMGQALEAAEKAGMVDLPLRVLFQSAIRTGRRVREETEISRNALSVSSVAVDLAARAVGRLEGCTLLVVGAGEAGRLVAKAARERGIGKIVVASRTQARAAALAATLGGLPVSMSKIDETLHTCHIVVTCADAPRRLLDVGRVKEAMTKRPGLPLVLIDIAVPRNVAPAVSQLDNVFLYNIDDLTHIAEANRRQREGEMQKAARIIAAELARLAEWQQELKVRPVVTALMKRAEDIRQQQLTKTLKRLRPLSVEEQEDLEAMTRSIVTKILNGPIQYLKDNGHSNGHYAEMLGELFRLEIADDKN
ncbi:MAG: glutamyl-tRNA reductase [Chloroflexi bacterium]|nr:glutamyl-tRNA reductase [Chloroflexota bacterium]